MTVSQRDREQAQEHGQQASKWLIKPKREPAEEILVALVIGAALESKWLVQVALLL